MVYAATLSESQRAMLWRLIIHFFGPNIQYIDGVDKIADPIIRLPSTNIDKYDIRTKKAQCCVNKLSVSVRAEKNEHFFPLNLLNLQREQQKDLKEVSYKLNTYIPDQVYGYSKQDLDDTEIICYDRNIYVEQTLRIRVLD